MNPPTREPRERAERADPVERPLAAPVARSNPDEAAALMQLIRPMSEQRCEETEARHQWALANNPEYAKLYA